MVKLPFPSVTFEAQRELLAAALELRSLNPWITMGDQEMLAWEDPVTGRLRMGVVLGIAGTMFGLAVYRGELGIRFVLKTVLHEDDGQFDTREGAEMDAVRVEFTRKGDLQPEDLALLKAVGFKPEKGISPPWPCFRSFLPGLSEWPLDQAETEMMTADLRRMAGYTRVLQAQPELLDGRPVDEFPFWPRNKPVTEPLTAAELTWHRLSVPPRPAPSPFIVPAEAVGRLRALPQQRGAAWEVDAAYMLHAIGEAPRPYYTRMGLAVDRKTGIVCGMYLGKRAQCLEHTAAAAIVEGMLKVGFRPKVLHLFDDAMRDVIQPVAAELEMKVTVGEPLYAFEEAMGSLMQAMERGQR